MKAIQDQLEHNHCYGCGADNPKGMQIKSYWDGATSNCTYMPRPEQCAGPTQYVYGGTIASLIDCHCVGTSIAAHYDRDGRAIGEGEPIWCVTGRLTVNYLKPTPIEQAIELIATVDEIDDRKALLTCRVFSDEIQVAEGEVISVRVPPTWRA
ncbi:MAG: PaaI family thioesterase [Woeseiaceae bacterium]|nr:PaaI family thioesterase [Woeseiaceae bacterium]